MSKLIRYLSITAITTIVSLPAISARAQTYDFSMTFSGMTYEAGGGNVTISGLVTFDGGTVASSDLGIRAANGSRISFSDGYFFSGNLGVNQTFDSFSFSAVISQPDNPDATDENGSYDNTLRGLTLTYPETSFGATIIQVESTRLQNPTFFTRNTIAEYTLGGEIVDTDTKETVSGNDPVAVPEINGGRAVLMAFILATLGLAMSARRRRAGPPHTVATFA